MKIQLFKKKLFSTNWLTKLIFKIFSRRLYEGMMFSISTQDYQGFQELPIPYEAFIKSDVHKTKWAIQLRLGWFYRKHKKEVNFEKLISNDMYFIKKLLQAKLLPLTLLTNNIYLS